VESCVKISRFWLVLEHESYQAMPPSVLVLVVDVWYHAQPT
jgi:hypothetical protein